MESTMEISRVLVVGDDRTRAYAHELSSLGVECAGHWRGRRPAEARRALPPRIDAVVLIWTHVSHALAESVRSQAAARRVPVIYCRSSAEVGRRLSTLRVPRARAA